MLLLIYLLFFLLNLLSTTPGNKVGKSLLIDDGALPWIVKNANNEASPIRRHIELALCHLAQHGKISYWFNYFNLVKLFLTFLL